MEQERALLRELSARKEAMEHELEALAECLTAGNGPGLHGNLVDRQGFPRADIDIPTVRGQRQRVACLMNDHKQIMKQIDEGLGRLHQHLRSSSGAATAAGPAPPTLSHGSFELVAEGRRPSPPPPAAAAPTIAAAMGVGAAGPTNGVLIPPGAEQTLSSDVPPLLAFARVHEVSEASPASEAGIQVGDSLVSFGAVSCSASPGTAPSLLLQQVAQVLQAHEGGAVQAVVLEGVSL
eukprot:CAMPEP_0202356354 /NCGR_PEP_ID=MMETSP1126-20121109/10855_1 /ASSEMBLY_ACC=CAM_ASM_000457 /TAXON_ID=3047 /ORGANISM="Dunaliella tertiolecta, Strain CCMP1320" /LENGTH=235 /DNA_ID=CAMNT_0048949099 /DNA_START=47 /DNA_END=755 /DNA_ORIENTATION=+